MQETRNEFSKKGTIRTPKNKIDANNKMVLEVMKANKSVHKRSYHLRTHTPAGVDPH